jgi:antitoxin MazE
MGNSTGMILPKPILQALGVTTGALIDLSVEDGRVIASPVKRAAHEDWEAAAKRVGGAPLDSDAQAWLGMNAEAELDWEW